MRRFVATAACAALTLLIACGDDGPDPFTKEQVADTFQRVTGDRLVLDPGGGGSGVEVLRLDRGAGDATAAESRYGTFSVYVVRRGSPDTLYKKDLRGEEIRPDSRGIYWRRLSGNPPAWQASRRFRNVVLQWQAGKQRATDERWRRLDAAFSSLGRPSGRVRLSPEDTPCRRRGIDPLRSGKGTCKEGAQTLVVVPRGHALRLPTYVVGGVRLSVRRTVGSAGARGSTTARGRFVVLRFLVANRGNEPLERVTPTLAIGKRRYALDTRALFFVQERSPFPIQPGERAGIVALYDIPVRAARRVRRRGALLVNGDPEGAAATIEAAGVVGVVRMRRGRR